jgi:transposase
MLGALTFDGLAAVMTISGGTDKPVFRVFAEHFLAPLLRPGDVVLLDNLAAHKDHDALAFIYAAGATVKFTPPYSPEYNPIELAWSKVKSLLRTAKARTLDELNDAVAWAQKLISPQDAAAWFRHCGFRIQGT